MKEIVVHNPENAADQLDSADLVNDYLMKQINNDPRNHLQPKDYIENLLGKDTGKMINHVADNTADKITNILREGSAQLEQVKAENEKKTGVSKQKVEE